MAKTIVHFIHRSSGHDLPFRVVPYEEACAYIDSLSGRSIGAYILGTACRHSARRGNDGRERAYVQAAKGSPYRASYPDSQGFLVEVIRPPKRELSAPTAPEPREPITRSTFYAMCEAHDWLHVNRSFARWQEGREQLSAIREAMEADPSLTPIYEAWAQLGPIKVRMFGRPRKAQ